MPMRQPCLGERPLCSACMSKGAVPWVVNALLPQVNETDTGVPACSVGKTGCATNRSLASGRVMPLFCQCWCISSIQAPGPHIQVLRCSTSGTAARRAAALRRPETLVKCCTQRSLGELSFRSVSAFAKIWSCGLRQAWTNTRSPSNPRACKSRSMAITGVIPLPALSSKILAGKRAGKTNSPIAGLIFSTAPARTWSCKKPEIKPPGCRLTVMAKRRAPGREDRLYTRDSRRPEISNSTRMNCPAAAPCQSALGCKTKVLVEGVSSITRTTLARTCVSESIGCRPRSASSTAAWLTMDSIHGCWSNCETGALSLCARRVKGRVDARVNG